MNRTMLNSQCMPAPSTIRLIHVAAGVGTIGTTKALPVTVWGQYRFGEAKSAFRPYLGAGLTAPLGQ